MEKGENRKKEFACVVLFAIFSAVLRSLLTNYDKIMSIYPDELVYYGISKSLFNGTGILVHGNSFSVQNIAYSFFLTPFMMIENSITRLKIIMLANRLLLSSSVVPVWLICKEFSLKKKYRMLPVVIILLWPDMAMSGVLMAENLYWPLTIWAVYFIFKFLKTAYIRYVIPAGLMSYLAYFCKEVAICLPLAMLGYFLIYPVIQRLLFKENIKITYNKKNLLGLVIYLCLFVGGYIFVKQFLFYGETNAYANANTMGLNAILSVYNFMYMLYAFLYYLIAIILAFGIFPICYSIVFYKYLDKLTQKVIVFLFVFLSGSALMIAYTITVREELGTMVMRVHLRYISAFVAILIPLFFKIAQALQDCEINGEWEKKLFWVLGAYSIVLLFLFKGAAPGASIEHCAISYYDLVQSTVNTVTANRENSYIFYPFASVVNLFVVFLVFKINIHIVKQKSVSLFIITLIVVNCINNYATEKKIYEVHSANSAMVSEMSNINDWFHENGVIHENILYIGESDKFSSTRKIFDTYFDGTNIITMSSGKIDEHQRLMNTALNVDDFKFTEVIWERSYDDISNVCYIIAEKAGVSGLTISNVDEITELSAETYIVYQNRDSTKLTIMSPEPDIQIWFYGSNYNCNLYDLQGISGMEAEYTWTDGVKVSFNIPAAPKSSYVHACITVGGTYNGKQDYSIISGAKCLMTDTINGGGKIEFDVPVINGQIAFDIMLPNALSPKEKGESEDPRDLSLQLLNASFFYES